MCVCVSGVCVVCMCVCFDSLSVLYAFKHKVILGLLLIIPSSVFRLLASLRDSLASRLSAVQPSCVCLDDETDLLKKRFLGALLVGKRLLTSSGSELT